MKRVLFVVSVLSSGGAARVLSVLGNYFSNEKDFQVSVLTHIHGSGYDFDSRILLQALYSKDELRSSLWNKIWRRIVYWPRLVRAVLRNRPDTVVVFLRGMNWRLIIICRILGIRVVAAEHTNHLAERGFWTWVERRWVYPFASALTVLTEFDRRHYATYLNQVRLIPNPASFPVTGGNSARRKIILAAGSLDRWHIKGFDTLIDVFFRLSSSHPDWKLRIVGPGDKGRMHLIKLVQEKGLEKKVELPGFSSILDQEMAESEVFCLTSRHEGFSMVLLEAMSKGCACISFDCPAGPADLLENGLHGVLIPHRDIDAFCLGLDGLLGSEKLRYKYSRSAIEFSRNYEVEKVAMHWREIL